ncbi:hypothetical protein GCM10027435_01330 [Haloparvum alkalitolerans]|uniref:hypothetical protein n=1 Tax=Haloparvum alkalitolerans TaxID=1042953 RepID=UPI003CEC9012
MARAESDDPINRALFGRSAVRARRAIALAGAAFVAAAAGLAIVERFYGIDAVVRPLWWQAGALVVVAATAAHAYLNGGLLVCWLLAFGPLFGVSAGLGGAVFAEVRSGLLATAAASAVGAGAAAVLLGGAGFLIGYGLRYLLR